MAEVAQQFHCRLITPEGKLFDEGVDRVTAPALRGYLGILAGHAGMVAILQKGILSIKGGGVERHFAVDSGSLEVTPTHDVIVLTDRALKGETEDDARQKLAEFGGTIIKK